MLLKVLTLVFCVSYVSADISSECLSCICEVESNCQPLPCRIDVRTPSCGYYQIKHLYYTDCDSPGPDWQSCSVNKICADECVRNYMKRYGTYCSGKASPTCEGYARIHNGGPSGCKSNSTRAYWYKVQACLNRRKK